MLTCASGTERVVEAEISGHTWIAWYGPSSRPRQAAFTARMWLRTRASGAAPPHMPHQRRERGALVYGDMWGGGQDGPEEEPEELGAGAVVQLVGDVPPQCRQPVRDEEAALHWREQA